MLRDPFARAFTRLALAGLLGACSSSSGNGVHGPSFGGDGGPDSTAGGDSGGEEAGGPDGSQPIDAGRDGATPGMDATMDAPHDAGSETSAEASVPDSPSETSPPPDGPTCASTMALLAMGPNGIAESLFSGGAWAPATTATPPGGAAPPSGPAIAAYGTEYVTAFVTAGSGMTPLDWTLQSGAWAPPSQVLMATAQGTPSLAVIGTDTHIVYWGSNGEFYHGTFSSGAWQTDSDPVEPDGGAQSFGSSPPVVAAVGSTLVVAQSGGNGVLYDQTWTGAWQAANAQAGTSVVTTIAPAIVALTGGSADLMIVFVHDGDAGDYHLQFTVRSGGTWSAPADVYDQSGTIAYSSASPSLAALPGGGAIVAWLGGSPASPYASTYSPSGGWTAPASIANVTLSSAPSVAAGGCGNTATAAFVQTTGELDTADLTGGTCSAPVAIAEGGGMQSVAITSSP
jgi:hypothetical protein